jgi:hypothetical protein
VGNRQPLKGQGLKQASALATKRESEGRARPTNGTPRSIGAVAVANAVGSDHGHQPAFGDLRRYGFEGDGASNDAMVRRGKTRVPGQA